MNESPACLGAMLMLAIRHDGNYPELIDCDDDYRSFLLNTKGVTAPHSDLDVVIGLGRAGVDINALLVSMDEAEIANLARDGHFRIEINHPDYGPFAIVTVIDPHRLPENPAILWEQLGDMPLAAWIVHQASDGRVFACGLLR